MSLFKILVLNAFLIYSFTAKCQLKQPNSIGVLWYNVENLFDTLASPNSNDQDFTPDGKLRWDSKKYNQKLQRLSQVISSCQSGSFPALIGLCEVENKSVLIDLVQYAGIKKANYKIVHEDSPDERGIDVAFLYRDSVFNYLGHKSIKIILDGGDLTRDILYVKGKMNNETVHCFINHWPSRRGGEESEQKRVKAAYTLSLHVDSICKEEPNAKIMIMGDLNDEPQDMSVFVTLNASNKPGSLFNLCLEKDKNGLGTHFYKDGWNMLDNFIVSPSLLDGNGLVVKTKDATIYSPDWLTWFDKKNQVAVPSRTYAGSNYTGGYSDHFPLFIEFVFNQE